MRYVFFGTPAFAAIILKDLIERGMPPVAIICNPDRPFGRKKIITPPPTKIVANASKAPIQIFQPEKVREIIPQLKKLNADVFVVAAYAKIIPPEVYGIPTCGTVGVHPSLLPRYRGPSPIQYALLNGETTTGVTLYALDNEIDHGPLYASSPCAISASETMPTLMEKLAHVAGDLLYANLGAIIERKMPTTVQDEAKATFTKKISAEDAFVSQDDLHHAYNGDTTLAEGIARKIKAFNPEPGVWTMENDRRVKLLEANIEAGKLKILKIQRAGE